MKTRHFLIICCFSLFTFSCSDGGLNLFSIEQDVQLGMQLREEVLSNPQEYPVLSRSQYPQAYNYLENMVSNILESDDIRYKEEFPWEVYIIKDDNTLNAFAAPGGYNFVYTGLIKFLDTPDDLAGVLGHEMAHADQRHSTEQLTQTYGLALLLDVVLGNDQGTITNILASLLTLQFSRGDEREADEYSVVYLCDTEYAANSAASFFAKLINEGNAASPPEFLSTHPNPANRVEDINAEATERGCSTEFNSSQSAWNSFRNALP